MNFMRIFFLLAALYWIGVIAYADAPPVRNVLLLKAGTTEVPATGLLKADNGTLSTVAPGASGNVMTSNGSTWISQPLPAFVTSVTASSPLASSGGTTPNITIQTANSSTTGVLLASDWATFNAKEPAIAAGNTFQYWRGDKSWQTLNTSVVPEIGNQYFTGERVDDQVSGLVKNGTGIVWTYDDTANTFTPNVNLGQFATSHLAEGTNLYYTDERVDDRLNVLLQAGSGLSWVYNDAANTLTGAVTLSPFSTSDLSEGSNLYFTQSRARSAISATSPLSFNSGTGLFEVQTFSGATSGAGGIRGVVPAPAAGEHVEFLRGDGTWAVPASSFSLLVTDEGSSLTGSASSFNFVGSGVTATNSGTAITVSIPGDAVRTVNDKVGDVVLTTSDIAEGIRLYHTEERVDDRVASLLQSGTGVSWSYNDGSNTLTPTVSLAPFTTSNLTEGANLYFSNERVDDRVSALVQNGTGLSWTYDDALNTFTGVVSLSPFSTSNLSEGSSLYFTNARARAALSVGAPLTYNSTSGLFGISDFTGASSGAAGTRGTVPAPQAGDQDKFLKGDGTWTAVASGGGSDIAVSDEGSSLTAGATSFNFTGGGVTASNTGTAVTVNVPADAVSSVNSQTGAVSLTTSHINEGSNLYFTDARARTATVDDTAYNATSWDGVLNIAPSKNAVRDKIASMDTAIASKEPAFASGTNSQYLRGDKTFQDLNTAAVAESSNLYFTDERVDDRASALVQNGTGISWAYSDTNGTLTPTVSLGAFSTTNLSEGTNLYFTNERVDDRTDALIQDGTGIAWTYDDGANTLTPAISLSAFSTTNLSEGSNLYFTDARARTAAVDDTAYDATSWNGITNIAPSKNAIRDWIEALTTSGVPEGSNLYYTDARARAAISATAPVTYNNSTGVIDINTFGAATSGAAGSKGAVPAPAAGEDDEFLRGDGTWAVPVGGSAAISVEDEGVELTASVASINFTGGGVTASNTGDDVTVSIPADAVSSVNTKTGAVVLVTDDIAEDGSPVNLWFTNARAKAAAVSDEAYSLSTWNGVTDVAPSKNAVRDWIDNLGVVTMDFYNKSFSDASTTIFDSADTTSKMVFNLDNLPTGITYTLKAPTPVGGLEPVNEGFIVTTTSTDVITGGKAFTSSVTFADEANIPGSSVGFEFFYMGTDAIAFITPTTPAGTAANPTVEWFHLPTTLTASGIGDTFLVATTSTQTLTQKTLSTGSKSSIAWPIAEVATPSTLAGHGHFYFKSDNKPYARGDDGTEYDLSAGGGGGGTAKAALVAQWFAENAGITKTNIGTSYVDVYTTGLNGRRLKVDFTGYTQFMILCHYNHVGTGTQNVRVIDAVTTTNVLGELPGTTGAAEKEVEMGFSTLPAWATGESYLKVQMKSTTAGDDPVYRDCSVQLK
jgi:hypothetical protein